MWPLSSSVRPRSGFFRSTSACSGGATRLLACCSAFVAKYRLALAFLCDPNHNLQHRSRRRQQHPAPPPNLRFNSDVPSARRLTSYVRRHKAWTTRSPACTTRLSFQSICIGKSARASCLLPARRAFLVRSRCSSIKSPSYARQ